MAAARTTFMISDRCVTAARHIRTSSGWALDKAVAVRIDAPLSLVAETDLSDYVEPVVELVHAIGADDAENRLLIPGTWVFGHAIKHPSRRRDMSAASFELEGFLPMPLEDATCAFVPIGQCELLGLAVATEPLRRLLGSLAERSVHIDAIEIDALAAACCAPVNGSDAVGTLWVDRHHVSIVVTDRDKHITALRTARIASFDRVDDELALLSQSLHTVPDAWGAVGLLPSEAATVNRLSLVCRASDLSAPDPADSIPHPQTKARGANLRVGPLAFGGRWDRSTRLATRSVALLVLVLVLLAAGFHRQRTAVSDAIATMTDTECALYARAFPDRSCPPGIALRVASERIRLEGLTRRARGSGDDASLPDGNALLAALRDLVAAIPTEVRLFVQDLRLDEGHLSLRGTAKTHAEAERIAKALRTVDGVTPSPPRSDTRREGGVNFSLHARRGPDDSTGPLATR